MTDINTFYDKTVELISQNRLRAATEQMKQHSATYKNWSEAIRSTEEILQPLTTYLLQGTEDSQRSRIIDKLKRKLLVELDKYRYYTYVDGVIPHPMNIEFLRLYPGATPSSISPDSALAMLQGLVEKAMTVDETSSPQDLWVLREQLFRSIWTMPPHKEGFEEILQPLLERENASEAHLVNLGTIIGALTVGGMEVFCVQKLRALTHLFQHSNPKVFGWAVSAYIILSTRHAKRMKALGDLRGELFPPLPKETPHGSMHSILYELASSMYLTFTTQEDYKRYKEEVLPQLQNMAKKIDLMRRNNDLESLIAKAERGEQDSELIEAIEEIQKSLPKERDLNYLTTAEIRHTAFFSHMVNWWMPFDRNHFLLDKEDVSFFMRLMPMASKESFLCSGDLYAFAALGHWQQMAKMSGATEEQLPREQPGTGIWSLGTVKEGIRDFIYTAYRFYYLYRVRVNMHNPFEQKPLLIDAYPAQEVLLSVSEMRTLGGMLAKLNFNKRALKLITSTLDTPQDYRLAALLAEKEDREAYSEDIVNWLEKAYEMDPSHPGTRLKLADILLKRDRDSDEAKELLDGISDEDTDSLPVLNKLAQLTSKAGEPEKALDLYFKAYYITDGKDYAVIRSLARQLFRLDRFHDAMEKWQLLPKEQMRPIDAMGLGHALLAMQQPSEAIKAYQLWIDNSTDPSYEQWEKLYVKPVSDYYTDEEWGLLYDAMRHSSAKSSDEGSEENG